MCSFLTEDDSARLLKLGGHRAINDLVTDLDVHPAEDGGINSNVQANGPSLQPAQDISEATTLLGIEWRCHPNLRDDSLALPRSEIAKMIDNSIDSLTMQVTHCVLEHLTGGTGRATIKQIVHDRRFRGGRLCRAGEGHLQFRGLIERSPEPEQLIIRLVEGAVGLRHRENHLISKLLDCHKEIVVIRPTLTDDPDHDRHGEFAHLAPEDLADQALSDSKRLTGICQRHSQLVLMFQEAGNSEQLIGKTVEPSTLTTCVKSLGLTRKRITAGS